MQREVRLPDYAGSLLRGQFGAALREIACMTPQPVCNGCTLLKTCLYTRIFEAVPPEQHTLQKFSQIPNAYVIEPPQLDDPHLQADDILQFNMVLVGDAIEQLALVIFVWQRALTQGLTQSRSAAHLVSVEWIAGDGPDATVIWSDARTVITMHSPTLTLPASPAALQEVTLKFHTPLRLQHQGKPLRADQLDPHAVVAAVARRAALVLEFHARQPQWGPLARDVAHLANSLTDSRELQWFDWTRYSSRQKQEMTLGGLLGQWTLHGSTDAIAQIWPWLWLGQWLHVGKNATMGLGAYTLYSQHG
jgi:hypothetical protein